MGALTAATPKPLLGVAGRPILEHIVAGLAAAGARELVVVTGYLGEQIERHFGDGGRFGVSIAYRRQERTDGTGGALLLARDLLGDGPFLLSWGDILVEPGLYRRMVERFAALPCDVLLSVNPVDDPWRGGAVYVDDAWRVERIVEKPARGTSTTRWNNAGVFVFSPLVLDYTARLEPSPRGEYELPQAIARMVADGRDVRAIAVGDFWSDVGTPEDLEAVQGAFARCLAAGGSPAVGSLAARFREHFGAAPELVARAPGRVNLIGEHTDYNGLPVLPMAIDRSVRIAARRRGDGLVRLANVEPRFAAREYELAAAIPPFAAGDWGNYHKAAVQGLLRHLGGEWRGGDFLVEGDVPAGAGLSSSSAFVVAAALAFLAVNQREVEPVELAEAMARAERYVGTLSGGMDQAASLLGRAGCAVRIDFFPLRVQPVPLPADVAVVVCHSLVQAEKSAGARVAYNTRVVECRMACRVLNHVLARELPRPLERLGDLAALFPSRPLASFVEPLAAALPAGALRLSEVAKAAATYPGKLARDCEVPAGLPDRFAVLARARHVLTEAERVAQAVEALASGSLARLGELMAASHASCRDDYEISCAELEDLVASARRGGALGARLTGAGFGGCTVNLVARGEVERFLAHVDREFYRPRVADPVPHRFVLAAAAGAAVERS